MADPSATPVLYVADDGAYFEASPQETAYLAADIHQIDLELDERGRHIRRERRYRRLTPAWLRHLRATVAPQALAPVLAWAEARLGPDRVAQILAA